MRKKINDMASAAPAQHSVQTETPAYTQPQQQYYNQSAGYASDQANREPLGVGNYIGIFFLSAIPMAGFILLLMWAFGGNVNINKKNFARAVLIMSLIAVGIWVIFFIIILAIGGSVMDNIYY